jgi:hypothetical protein
MMVQRVGYADREAQAEESLREAERPDVSVAAEESASNYSPYQRGGSEHEIGQMRNCKQRASDGHSGRFAGNQAQQAIHE